MKPRVRGVLLCALLLALVGVLLALPQGSNADLLGDMAKKTGMGKAALKGIVPNLMDQLKDKTKSKVCREQIQAVQKKVAADPDTYMMSSQSLLKTMCGMSKFCISEIFKAIDKAVPGGPRVITKYLQEKLGIALPMDVDLETLMITYYDMTCAGEEKPSIDTEEENNTDDDSVEIDVDEL